MFTIDDIRASKITKIDYVILEQPLKVLQKHNKTSNKYTSQTVFKVSGKFIKTNRFEYLFAGYMFIRSNSRHA